MTERYCPTCKRLRPTGHEVEHELALFGPDAPAGSHLPNPSDRLTDRDEMAARLVRQLGKGRANIRGGHDLAEALGVSQRMIGGVVHRAREQGALVGSSHGEGYYLIQTRDELDATIAHIERRARGLRETITLLRDAFVAAHTEESG